MSGAMPMRYKFSGQKLFQGAEIPSIYFQGSTLFQPVADRFGIELDQINFLICELFGIIIGTLLRLYLPAEKKKNHNYRLLVCGLGGVVTALFCFGLRSLYLWAITTVCYAISYFSLPKYSHLIVFVTAVGYLSYLHIYRMVNDYGGYSLDITMPMMVIVQKITAYAFAIHDGGKERERPGQLRIPEQARHAIKSTPDYWVFCSYVFSFQSLLCGPFCFFDEYMDFIQGRSVNPSSYKKNEDIKSVPKADGTAAGSEEEELLPPPQFHPSPLWPVTRKVLTAAALCYLHITLVAAVPLELLTDDAVVSKLSFFQLMFYILIATTFIRLKYYLAWLLSDAVANASGLGFNGYDELGKARWDLVSNVDIIEVEFAYNLRGCLAAWNSCTARWLRYVAYDRAVVVPMVATYSLSAFWHGFYPGYYVTFLSGALFTEAARWGRRVFRPPFQKWRSTQILYDFITFFCTRIVLSYTTFPFVLLELRYAWNIYKALYFWLHIVAVLAVVGLPYFWKKPRRDTKKADGEVTAYRLDKAGQEDGALPSDKKPSDVAGGARKDAQFAEKPATG
ncbi:hypothetical protein RvY_18138 [Ramazzottius varieornatus]|uniref:Uncharacterized protein n=1 Tax=Ramazzottius varieornatus TaxID=947166 RepID=A0A1D1W6G5_RAMVA|nr:hypothetical protein RvY_18138 [Ramazzottius varieornatus]